MTDTFEGFALEAAIGARAAASGIVLPDERRRALAEHARLVIRRNEELHLTTITDPVEFVERHLGEAFEGAALLPEDASGALLDFGSGNGYPGLPFAAARPGMRPMLVEASERKAGFLREAARIEGLPRTLIVHAHVQRAADLENVGPLDVLTARAVGGWEKVLPKLAPLLAPAGRLLLWAGADVEKVAARVAWRRYERLARHPLPGREQSWVWVFGRAT